MRNIIIIISIIGFAQTIIVCRKTVGHSPDSCKYIYDSTLNRSYYISTDLMPTFKGGQDELMKTINENLKWPGERCDIEGTVFVSCIIESNGQLTNKRILEGLSNSEGCNADKEALRVIDFLTTWNPGQCEGRDVATLYVILVRFEMEED